MMYGHDQAGDGFTAGVITSLAIASWNIVFGYEETQRRLPWPGPFSLISTGLLLRDCHLPDGARRRVHDPRRVGASEG